MRDFSMEKQFRRDAKKYYLELITPSWNEIFHCLLHDKPLPAKYEDHALKGNFARFRDCHLKADLILIYKKTEDNLLQFVRLGTHSEIFDNY